MQVKIFCDGACLGNPGPGGYAAITRIEPPAAGAQKEIVIKGGEAHTTNNRMEMRGFIEAFRKFLSLGSLRSEAKTVAVFSDSSLLVKTMNHSWKKKENLDLWNELLLLVQKFEEKGGKVSWHWVKGHAGHPENTRCDKLANGEAKKFKYKARGATLPKTTSFFCNYCGKAVSGKLTRLSSSGLIKASCELCGKFIKFAKHTKEILDRTKTPEQKQLF